MVWISLFDRQSNFLGYIQMQSLPVTGALDYRCMPHGMLPFENVVELSRTLNRGTLDGDIRGYHWYRQATNHDALVLAGR
jgi:hypothetical protein